MQLKTTNTRYYSFKQYLKEHYPFHVRKIPVDAGFTCPNRDGTKSSGGCTYCLNRSFAPASIGVAKPVEEQIGNGIKFYKERFGAQKFIIYFQAYSNTYAHVDVLKETWDKAFLFDDVVGISVATRPDCISDKTLNLLQEYSRKVDLWLEIGLETSHNKTLEKINRCHTYEDFVDAVTRAKSAGLNTVCHTIFGLPGETHEEMMQTADRIAKLPIDFIKIHHLYISRYTQMEKEYNRGEIKLFTLDEWVNTACDIIERLPPTMVIQRLVGELSGPYVVAPLWNKPKSQIIQQINKELGVRDSKQGVSIIW